MNTLPYKLGFWASVSSAILFISFTICFAVLLLSNVDQALGWTSLADYILAEEDFSLKHFAQLCMLLFCPLYVIIVNSVHTLTSAQSRVLTRLSLCFALAFCVLAGTMYFVQLSTARLAIQHGYTAGLEPFLQFYPYAGILSIGMLGITVFLGLSSLFLAPVFKSKNKRERSIQLFLWINGLCCLLGGVSYVMDWKILINLTINLGMGGSLIILSFLLAFHFFTAFRE